MVSPSYCSTDEHLSLTFLSSLLVSKYSWSSLTFSVAQTTVDIFHWLASSQMSSDTFQANRMSYKLHERLDYLVHLGKSSRYRHKGTKTVITLFQNPLASIFSICPHKWRTYSSPSPREMRCGIAGSKTLLVPRSKLAEAWEWEWVGWCRDAEC